MMIGLTNKPCEMVLTAERQYADIFNQVEVDVVFSSEYGATRRVPAFWDGDNSFRVRFAAPQPGEYVWRSECTQPDDAGLHGRSGKLSVLPYDGRCALYRHGRLRVAESHRTLCHSDGEPFLWLADTWWMGLTKRLDWPDGFRRLVEDRVRKGFNTIQIVAGPLPDFTDPWDPQQANEAGWPWEKDFARINPRFFDLADLRLAYLVEQGLMPCIVSMWGYYLPLMGVQRVKQHWRYLVARYGAYPVTWCLAGECTMPIYTKTGEQERKVDSEIQKTGWTDVARYVRRIDPCHNLLTAHPSWEVSGRESLADDTLLDFEMLQTGHSGYQSLTPSTAAMRAGVTRRPQMPVLNGEVNYEGIMGGSKDEVQRFLFWASMLQGACGHTYGTFGICTMNARDEPYVGVTLSWADGFWQDDMHYPGSAHVGIGARILQRYPWWRLEPCEEPAATALGRELSFVGRIPGELIVAYLPCCCFPEDMLGCQGSWGQLIPLRIENDTKYRAVFINPCSGYTLPIGEVVAENGEWMPPRKPTMADWLLVLEAQNP